MLRSFRTSFFGDVRTKIAQAQIEPRSKQVTHENEAHNLILGQTLLKCTKKSGLPYFR